MKDMTIFSDELCTSFADEFQKFITELGLNSSYRQYHGLDNYFEKLYLAGELKHNDDLDSLVRRCFFISSDEFDIAFSTLQALKTCLENGYKYAELKGLPALAVEALEVCSNICPAVFSEKETYLIAVKALFKGQSIIKNVFLRDYITGKYKKASGLGFALFSYEEIINPLINSNREFVLDPKYDCVDIYNVACCLGNGYTFEEALQFIEPFKGKGYKYEEIVLLTKRYNVSELAQIPNLEPLLGLILRNECLYDVFTLNQLIELYERYFVKRKCDTIYIEQLYRAGFTVSFMSRDFNEPVIRFFQLVDFLKRFTENSRLERNYLYNNNVESFIDCNGNRVFCFKPDYTLEVLRRVYYWEELEVDLDSVYDINHYTIDSWLNSLPITEITNSKNAIKSINAEIDEVQIICSSGIAFQFPTEFLPGFKHEMSKWVVSNGFTKYRVTLNKKVKVDNVNVLAIAFYKDTDTIKPFTLRSNPLAFSIDFATKKQLLFERGVRIDQPLLMIMLYEHFHKANKDTSMLSGCDLQTILALAQVLILQKSDDYTSLFNREDSFIKGFHMLRWFVRADDNFFSALLRYNMVLAGIRTPYNNACVCSNLQKNVIVNGAEHDVMGFLKGDQSLLQTLKENKDVIKPRLEGDVMYFE